MLSSAFFLEVCFLTYSFFKLSAMKSSQQICLKPCQDYRKVTNYCSNIAPQLLPFSGGMSCILLLLKLPSP